MSSSASTCCRCLTSGAFFPVQLPVLKPLSLQSVSASPPILQRLGTGHWGFHTHLCTAARGETAPTGIRRRWYAVRVIASGCLVLDCTGRLFTSSRTQRSQVITGVAMLRAVLSDMAHNFMGIASADHIKQLSLVQDAYTFAKKVRVLRVTCSFSVVECSRKCVCSSLRSCVYIRPVLVAGAAIGWPLCLQGVPGGRRAGAHHRLQGQLPEGGDCQAALLSLAVRGSVCRVQVPPAPAQAVMLGGCLCVDNVCRDSCRSSSGSRGVGRVMSRASWQCGNISIDANNQHSRLTWGNVWTTPAPRLVADVSVRRVTSVMADPDNGGARPRRGAAPPRSPAIVCIDDVMSCCRPRRRRAEETGGRAGGVLPARHPHHPEARQRELPLWADNQVCRRVGCGGA